MKSTSCRDVRSKSFCCNADPSSRIDHWPVQIIWRRRSDRASLVKGSAIMVLPCAQRIFPLSSFTSCLMSAISIDSLLSPHCEAGLVHLLTASCNDFESVMRIKGSWATSRCHSRSESWSPLASKIKMRYQCTDPSPRTRACLSELKVFTVWRFRR